jgi:hypothetical protein
VPQKQIPNLDDDGFYLRIAEALSGCQLEQELKLYISEALELVKKCVGAKLPFKMSGIDYQDASLERLIDAFRKLSNNERLAADLRAFKNERNFLSHNAIAHSMDPQENLGYREVVALEPRLSAIVDKARRLRESIHLEANRFRGHLWCDDLEGGR